MIDLSDPTIRILLASVGGGIGFELIRRYRGFKAARRARSFIERNAGFWTDGRVYLAEAAVLSAALALPFTAIIILVGVGRGAVYAYLAILAYTAALFFLMKSINGDPAR